MSVVPRMRKNRDRRDLDRSRGESDSLLARFTDLVMLDRSLIC